jgi:hypothetical protein
MDRAEIETETGAEERVLGMFMDPNSRFFTSKPHKTLLPESNIIEAFRLDSLDLIDFAEELGNSLGVYVSRGDVELFCGRYNGSDPISGISPEGFDDYASFRNLMLYAKRRMAQGPTR